MRRKVATGVSLQQQQPMHLSISRSVVRSGRDVSGGAWAFVGRWSGIDGRVVVSVVVVSVSSALGFRFLVQSTFGCRSLIVLMDAVYDVYLDLSKNHVQAI